MDTARTPAGPGGGGSGGNGMKWLTANWQEIPGLVGQHLALAVPAIVLAVVIAVPIGRFANSHKVAGGAVLGAAALLYAVPALPMLIMIPVIFGLPLRSMGTMIVALTIYGVALLVRTAADAFGAVDGQVRDAAIAIGHSGRSVFWQVDLPLATPVIVSGVRVMAVSTVALVTIGALIGQSGLGLLLTDGFQRGIAAEVVTGVVATIVLALALDGVVLVLGRVLTPWTRPGVAQARRPWNHPSGRVAGA